MRNHTFGERTKGGNLPEIEEIWAQHLYLRYLHNLKEIPSVIGEIPTLQSIEMNRCSYSANMYAVRIREEQEEFGNEDLEVRAIDYECHAAVLTAEAEEHSRQECKQECSLS